MNNAPVTMSIITEGAGTHFLMFLQHMIMSEQEYKLGQTPIHSTKQDFKNRWDTWTHGLEFNTPGPAKKNITLGGTSWNDQYNIETTEERLKYFDDIIAKDGAIHFGVIHSYPTWLEDHFSNINIIFHLGSTDEMAKKFYRLFQIKNGHVPDYDPDQWTNNNKAVRKNLPLCTIEADDLYTFCYRETVRKFINFTLSTTISEAQLDTLQYWIDLYSTRNDELLSNFAKT